MHVLNRLPVFGRHFHKALVPQDTGVVDQDIHPAEGIHGGFHDVFPAFHGGHVIVICHRLAAESPDLFDDFIGRGGRAFSAAVAGTTVIVDHNPGTASGQFQGIGPAQSGAGAGHDGHPVIETQLCRLCGGPGYRNGLPEIIDEPAVLVHTFALELHGHRQPDFDIIQFTVGKIGYQTPAAFKLDHTVNSRWIHRNRQHITGKSLHLGHDVSEFIIILAVNGATFGVDADIGFGKLRGVAFPAFAAHQPEYHFVFAPQGRGSRLSGCFGPDSHFRLDQISEFEPFKVVVGGLFIGQ